MRPRRLGFAAERARKELGDFIDGEGTTDAQAIRQIAFDLLRAYHLHRIEIHAAEAPDPNTDGDSETSDFITDQADSMATYTADNLAALVGSENWDAAIDETGGWATLATGDNPLSNVTARLAYYAYAADLRRMLEINRGAPDEAMRGAWAKLGIERKTRGGA